MPKQLRIDFSDINTQDDLRDLLNKHDALDAARDELESLKKAQKEIKKREKKIVGEIVALRRKLKNETGQDSKAA